MSLFEGRAPHPLADRLRPQTLDEVVGQEHILGEGQFLRKIIENQQPASIIFWGPPGTGKTTLARIMAQDWDLHFSELSAVTSGIKDVRKVIEAAQKRREMGEGTLLFVDEIHRFNKAQQDAFLPHVEKGTIILVGATTENPSFEINNALLSRLRVVTLEPLTEPELKQLIQKAIDEMEVEISGEAERLLAQLSGGDGRVAIDSIEAATKLKGDASQISSEDIKQALQRVNLQMDKGGDDYHNLISAYIKSLRGSDVDAALFYLHRMLEAGQDPLFIARRAVIFASEDVGMAAPYALTLAVSAFQAVERIGLPEGAYALTHITIALAEANKSRKVAEAMSRARQLAKDNPGAQVPLAIRNAPTELMQSLGYSQGYEWQADFKPEAGFLPEGLRHVSIYPQNSNKAQANSHEEE